uniref:Uncharacterized protein n=1 Tax=Romanomermis culicivorax TaxID=13658 RepID=A0A915L956_ROMCU
DLLRTLTEAELNILERALSSQEQLSTDKQKVALMSEFRYNAGNNSNNQSKRIEKTRRRSSIGASAACGPGPSFYKTQTPPSIKTILLTNEDDLMKKSTNPNDQNVDAVEI